MKLANPEEPRTCDVSEADTPIEESLHKSESATAPTLEEISLLGKLKFNDRVIPGISQNWETSNGSGSMYALVVGKNPYILQFFSQIQNATLIT